MGKKKDKIENFAACMLSILDSIKLHDNDSLELDGETLSEMMFRKMKGYNIDLNKELGFDHLKPVTRKYDYILNVDRFNEWFNSEKDWEVYAHTGIFLRLDKLSGHHFEDYISLESNEAVEYGSFGPKKMQEFEKAVRRDWVDKKSNPICTCGSSDFSTRESRRRTGPPNPIPKEDKFRRVSYGYRFKEHTCNRCKNIWEGERIN